MVWPWVTETRESKTAVKGDTVYPYNTVLLYSKKEWSANTAVMWVNLENIMLNERNQSQKVTYCLIP